MSNDLNYQVFPHEASHKTVTLSASQRKSVEGLKFKEAGDNGCLLWVGICIVVALFSISNFGYVLGAIIAIAVSGGAVAIISALIKSNKADEWERESTDRENQNEINRVKSEAEGLTSSLKRTHNLAVQLADELSEHLSQASAWLRDAENEYEDNAFSPFWDAVENAAQHLALFNDKANKLSRNADDYYCYLNGREHTFPIFPVQLDTIPDSSDEIEELRRIVRLGQTNFQFANIWEHRRTREVLIAGFRTLGEAVNNLGATIENSISNLQQSISSDLARVVDEQIKTRESLDKRMLEQNRMLDNIQHHHKPEITDRPTKY